MRVYTSHLSRLDVGIFLISFAVLFLELMLTRIFSVTLHYHLSFLAVSIVMLGLGVSGVLVNLARKRSIEEGIDDQLSRGARRFAVATIFVVGAAFYLSVSAHPSGADWVRLTILFGVCAIPFLAAGWVIALILTHNSERANRLYFFDLIGAALGCLLFIPATNSLGAPTAVLVGAAVAAAASIVLAGGGARQRQGWILTGILLAAAIANAQFGFYDIRITKGRRQAPTLAVEWNSFSRVEVQGTQEDLIQPRRPENDGLSARLDSNFRIRELYLRYDAEALTPITAFDGDVSSVWHLAYDVTSAPYHIRQYEHALIIGAGGGRDVLTALHMGTRRITGVEVNPITISLMRGQFRDFTSGIYDNYPNVRIVHDEARSFLQHSNEQYDLIQASLIDTWAASAAGAHALTENSLYTVDAFSDYLHRLTPAGIVSFTRWYFDPPVESLRVVNLAIEALKQHGIDAASDHIVVLRTNPHETKRPSQCTILVKKSPFNVGELKTLREWSMKMGFLGVYSPDDLNPISDFARLLSGQGGELAASLPYDISPVYDDRPFFFNRVPLLSWIGQRLGIGGSRAGEGELTVGGRTLLILLVLTSVSTIGLLFLPLLANRRSQSGDSRVPSSRAVTWAVYFGCLGLGFIVIEIVLIQRFSLFLGYPVYSLAVVLFTMLLASGVGSLLSGWWNGLRVLPRVFGLILLTVGLYGAWLPWILARTLGASSPTRIAVAALVVVPLAVLIGMPFPTGLRLAGKEGRVLVSWAWAVNGGASVFGSVLAVLISMTYGFTNTLLFGAAVYAVALIVFLILSTRVPAK